MRKEVKLGMAIGGGLIAVLVVYLFVAPPANNKNGTQLVTNGGNGSIIDVAQPGEPISSAPAADEKPKAGAESAGQATLGNGGGSSPELSLPRDAGNEQPTAPTGGKGKDKWNDALVKGKTDRTDKTDKADKSEKADKSNTPAPTPTGTPVKAKDREPVKPPVKHDVVALGTPSAGDSEPKLYFKPNEAWGGGISTHDLLGAGESHAPKNPAAVHASTPRGDAATAAARATVGKSTDGTHVVQAGDTLSSIAIDAYGSATYYPHILRANPTVNPNNLKLGTTLILPKADDVKATTAVGSERSTTTSGVVASVTQDAKIDPRTQYQVQSGDSLYKISLKVYGKSNYVEKIYERNKDIIGSDPKKLKLGMILELPEKAAVAVASPSQERTDTAIENDRR
jgi:LysM repeat protein